MSKPMLTPSETESLQEALKADYKLSSIRLREGEHQFGLAKAIAAFQLGLYFPDVKEIIKKLYGEEKTADVQMVRKVQTILKKMEKSNIVKILPKKKPWELQRYCLSSFKFQDVDKNMTVLATDEQIKQAQNLLNSASIHFHGGSGSKLGDIRVRIYTVVLALIVAVAYSTLVWEVIQAIVSPLILVSAFLIAIAGSVMLGRTLARYERRILP